jgi:TetR/AcrR family transcriptional repressor of nem operon
MMQEATTRSHLLIGLGGAMRKGEHTRQEIIRKAAPIFNQRGYDGAALSDLMKATGLEKGGIYRHFDSKQQLAAEAFDYAWEETLHARIHDLDGITNTVDRLKQLLANFVERRGIIPGGCPLLNTAIDSDDGNSVLRERARRALRAWRTYLVSIIRAGIKAREIRPKVDAQALATLIISALEGAVMVYRLERTEESLRAMQTHLDNYLENEVRAAAK